MARSAKSPIFAALPPAPGTYVLLLHLDSPAALRVGRLGTASFGPGWYAYVGSARGSGGLRARVARHLRADKRLHWHVDALTACVPVREVWWVPSMQRLECEWARVLAALPGVEQPVPGFGASDCACCTHLFRLPLALIDAAWRALECPVRLRAG